MDFKAFKMDGLGNDFIIIDQRSKDLNLTKEQVIKICDRNFIGCDQLILINKVDSNKNSLFFYNSDGSISGACGNGTRCVAKLLSEEQEKNIIKLETSSGKLISKILNDNIVETNIGKATIEWEKIPLSRNINTKNLEISIKSTDDLEFKGGIAVNVGNPHVVFFVENLEKYNIEKIGPEIENHKLFPEKCNVTIANILDDKNIKVKVWERGAGLTKSCGTAACATAFAGFITGMIPNKTNIKFELGDLSIKIENDHTISMCGAVSKIKSIQIKL